MTRIFVYVRKAILLECGKSQANYHLERKFNKCYSSDGVRICDESSEDIHSIPLLIRSDDKEYHFIGNLITVRKNYKVMIT
jgi:hypothetical protein